MRRSLINNTKRNPNRKGSGCLSKRDITNREVTKDSVTITSFYFTVLYYKRKNKVHKSKGVSKFDGTLTFGRSAGTTPSSVTLRDDNETVVYQGTMRGETGEFYPGQVISVGAHDVEILSLDKTSGNPSTITEKVKPLACNCAYTQGVQVVRKSLILGDGKSSRRVGLGGMRPSAVRTRKPALQPPAPALKKQKTSWMDTENSENIDIESSSLPSLSKPFVGLKRNTKTMLPGFKRPIIGNKTTSVGLGGRGMGARSSIKRNTKVLSSQKSTSTCTAKTIAPIGDTQIFFPGAIGNPMVPHSIRKVLRPHQVEGVVFLWNCLTGNGQAANLSPHFWDECDDAEHSDDERIGTKVSSRCSPKGCILSDGE